MASSSSSAGERDEDYVPNQAKKRKSSTPSTEDISKATKVFLSSLQRCGVPSDKIKSFKALLKTVGGIESATEELFNTPPSEMTKEKFTKIYGLVQVLDGSDLIQLGRRRTPNKEKGPIPAIDFPAYNKFTSNRKLDSVVEVVYALLACSMTCSIKALGEEEPIARTSKGKELRRECLQQLLLSSFRRFTKEKKKSYIAWPEDEPMEEESENEPLDLFIEKILYQESITGEDEDYETGDLVVKPQMSNPQKGKARQRSDIVAYVYRDSRLEPAQIVDFKSTAEVEHLFQPACYGLGIARNTEDARRNPHRITDGPLNPPIAIHVWDMNVYFKGYLEVHGFVTIDGNGNIHIPLDFKEEAEVYTAPNGMQYTPFTRAEVEKRYKQWKSIMKESSLQIPTNLHPVGRFYIDPTVEVLPHFGNDEPQGTPNRKSVNKFILGELRTFVGPKIDTWTIDDVFRAYYARRDCVNLTKHLRHVPKSYWKFIPGLICELKHMVDTNNGNDENIDWDVFKLPTSENWFKVKEVASVGASESQSILLSDPVAAEQVESKEDLKDESEHA